MDVPIAAHDHFARNIHAHHDPVQNHHPCHTARGLSQSTIATYAGGWILSKKYDNVTYFSILVEKYSTILL